MCWHLRGYKTKISCSCLPLSDIYTVLSVASLKRQRTNVYSLWLDHSAVPSINLFHLAQRNPPHIRELQRREDGTVSCFLLVSTQCSLNVNQGLWTSVVT